MGGKNLEMQLPDANVLVLIGQMGSSFVVESLDGANRLAKVVLLASLGSKIGVIAGILSYLQ